MPLYAINSYRDKIEVFQTVTDKIGGFNWESP